MAAETPNFDTIFCAAIEVVSRSDRAAYIAQACGEDHELRARVEKLVAAHFQAGSFLEEPAPTVRATGRFVSPSARSAVSAAGAECPVTDIGPYKLLKQIGEGGMGAVFLAEQTEPVQRTVALKLIKAGMDSRQVIARFEAERQALALMNHPNIAKVLDAGTTDSGRPYFVMELVEGETITKYCDQRRLTCKQRLELFLSVCLAVQHAHQKGIIHRDLKPSNVLVGEYDGKPTPKVIDFGVAKATGPKLTERTVHTDVGQVVGTLEYMSPEQAELNQLDIDTRSDTYSLGVVLYELLTGTTPLERKRFREAALLEALRLIREEEPPRPSTRLSTVEELPSIAANRGQEPKQLTGSLRGELDWIVMKCLEKDRNRRYDTVSGLAKDIERYLRDEPVQACPPSAWYRFRKFSRRNKVALATAAPLTTVLITATVVSGWQAVRATHAEQHANREAEKARTAAAIAQAVNDFINRDLLAQAQSDNVAYTTYTERTPDLKLVTVLDRAGRRLRGRFPDQPLVEAALHETIGQAYEQLDEKQRAEENAAQAVELRRVHLGADHPDTLRSSYILARTRGDIALIRETLEAQRRVLGEAHPDTLLTMCGLALQLRDKGETAEAVSLLRQIVATSSRMFGEDHSRTVWWNHVLAHTLFIHDANKGTRGAHDEEIERLYRQSLAVWQAEQVTTWHTTDSVFRLGEFWDARGRYQEAETVLKAAYGRMEALPGASIHRMRDLGGALTHVYGNWGKLDLAGEWERKVQRLSDQPEDPKALHQALEEDAGVLIVLGGALYDLGRFQDAETAYRAAVRRQPDDGEMHVRLGIALNAQNKRNEAVAEYQEAIRLKPSSGAAHHQLGDSLAHLGKLPEAEIAYREAIRLQPDNGGTHHNFADVLRRLKKFAEAETEYREAIRIIPEPAESYRLLGDMLCFDRGAYKQAIPCFEESIRLRPDNRHALDALGRACAFDGQWDKAASAFLHAAEVEPSQPQHWYRAATARLYVGDKKGYQRACLEMLKHFGNSDDPNVADLVARVSLLTADVLADRELATKLAERNVAADQHSAHRSFVLSKALSDYRAARHAAAVEWLAKFAPNDTGTNVDATALALLAMAKHRLGHSDEARQALAKAQAILAKGLPDPSHGRAFDDDWPNWLHAELLCREAEKLLQK